MKRTPLKRKTPLRAKKPLGQGKVPLRAKNTGKVAKRVKKPHKRSSLRKLKDQLWELCKQLTRKRHGLVCYTCKKRCDIPHTGHFISSSVCSTEMRYSLENLRPQCYRCNINLSGNWIAYERFLIADGVNVQELKDRNEKTKGLMYREDWYENKIAEYKSML